MKAKIGEMFGRTNRIERKIDEFFDKIVTSGMLFRKALQIYLEQGARNEAFIEKMHQVEKLESHSDELRREIETELYVHTLIPDLRGDVLSLLEEADKLINLYESGLFKFHTEQPAFPRFAHRELLRLTDTVCESAEQVVMASRAFFRDIRAVRDYSSKVQLLESEADKLSTSLLQQIFDSELDLALKMHLRYFVERVDTIANTAEDISDRLNIYAIKRRI